MGVLAIFFFSQLFIISLIVLILKKILDRNLIELAMAQLEAGRLNPPLNKPLDIENFVLSVTTHKNIAKSTRERIVKASIKNIPGVIVPHFYIDKKIYGGMIIRAGDQVADFSLADRLRRAK